MVDLQGVIVANFKEFTDYCWLGYCQAVLKIKPAVLRVSLKFLNRAVLRLSADFTGFPEATLTGRACAAG